MGWLVGVVDGAKGQMAPAQLGVGKRGPWRLETGGPGGSERDRER